MPLRDRWHLRVPCILSRARTRRLLSRDLKNLAYLGYVGYWERLTDASVFYTLDLAFRPYFTHLHMCVRFYLASCHPYLRKCIVRNWSFSFSSFAQVLLHRTVPRKNRRRWSLYERHHFTWYFVERYFTKIYDCVSPSVRTTTELLRHNNSRIGDIKHLGEAQASENRFPTGLLAVFSYHVAQLLFRPTADSIFLSRFLTALFLTKPLSKKSSSRLPMGFKNFTRPMQKEKTRSLGFRIFLLA